ncbi:MAG TPA: branched-chain amino acid ABC transporter permease, partial [Firmicutes bacterium]|nr:branched-chain amino acid ABC transporter permease [Bacillota bacterium]
MQTACLVLFYGYLGSCWNILGGYAGQLSYAHPTYLGLGAYTSSILFLRYGVSPWLGMFAGGAIAAVVAVGIGFPCFRLRGPFYALMTIAFLEVSRLLALNLSGLTGGPLGLIVQGWGDRPWHFQFRGYGPYLWIMAG